jgi:hypothetical protein
MSYNRAGELEVAAALEDIAVIAKTMSNDIREGVADPYARIYWLRTRMSRIVASMGAGQPGNQNHIAAEYEQYLSPEMPKKENPFYQDGYAIGDKGLD